MLQCISLWVWFILPYNLVIFFTVVSVPLHYIVSGVKLCLNTFVFGGFTRKDDIFGGFSFVLNIQWEVPWM